MKNFTRGRAAERDGAGDHSAAGAGTPAYTCFFPRVYHYPAHFLRLETFRTKILEVG